MSAPPQPTSFLSTVLSHAVQTITNSLQNHPQANNSTPSEPTSNQESSSMNQIPQFSYPSLISNVHNSSNCFFNVFSNTVNTKEDLDTMMQDDDLAQDHSLRAIVERHLQETRKGIMQIKRRVSPPDGISPNSGATPAWSPTQLPCIQFSTKQACFFKRHNQQYTYFEVTLPDSAFVNNHTPEVGLGFAQDMFKGMVGWSKQTIGFHMDNGRVYDERDVTNKIADRVFLSDVRKGDVIGCLLNHKNGEFVVVRNGQELHNIKHNTVFKHDHFREVHRFLPTISFSNIDIDVEVNLGLDLKAHPFKYHRVMLIKEREKMFEMLLDLNHVPHHFEHKKQATRTFFSDLSIVAIDCDHHH